MKVQDSVILFVSGLTIWILGTVFYGYRGAALLESGSLRYWIGFCVSSILSAVICIAILLWRHVPSSAWASGMLLLAIPGMIGEAIVLSRSPLSCHASSKRRQGDMVPFLFVAYAVALAIAEVVTLRAVL